MSSDSQLVIKERRLDGRPIFVVDGLLPADYVQLLYATFRALPFVLSDYDTEATKDVRHWKHEFDPDSLATHPLLRNWHDAIVARTVSLFPGEAPVLKRVHCNKHPPDDLQHAHTDIVPGITTLYFANAQWVEEWQGELVLYDANGEPFNAVAPRPGRLIAFAGDLLHRGGVPSRVCPEARISVAFKFSSG